MMDYAGMDYTGIIILALAALGPPILIDLYFGLRLRFVLPWWRRRFAFITCLLVQMVLAVDLFYFATGYWAEGLAFWCVGFWFCFLPLAMLAWGVCHIAIARRGEINEHIG